jgi:hypothetical protein
MQIFLLVFEVHGVLSSCVIIIDLTFENEHDKNRLHFEMEAGEGEEENKTKILNRQQLYSINTNVSEKNK